MEHFELRCLCDYVGAAQAADTWVRPTPLAVNGELQTDERAEVVYMEIWSPVEPVGDDDEALKKVVPVIDGHEWGGYISLSGVRSTVMAPPRDRVVARGADWSRSFYTFGTPMSNNPLLSTTIKAKESVSVACLAGPASAGPTPPESPITVAYRVRLWGYVYKTSELSRVFGVMGGVPGMPEAFALLGDKARNRTLILSKGRTQEQNRIRVTGESWVTLPGGRDQSIPKINPFARYAYNLLATDAMQGDYQFRLQTGGVFEEEENMYFDFDDKDALLIEGMGVKADLAADLGRTGLRIAGDYHPKGTTTRTSLYPTDLAINELNFGHLFPFAPIAHPYYAAIPRLARPMLIWNEIGYPVIRDDGTAAVIVDGVCIVLTGIRIEMRG